MNRNRNEQLLRRAFLVSITGMLLVLTLLALTGCRTEESSDRLHVVATIFPPYDWTRELLQGVEEAELTVLVENGVDLHSYQPSAQDIVQISTCDVFIYIGGESDAWVTEVLANAPNDLRKEINLMDILGDGKLAVPSGEEHEHEHTEHCHHVHDEHVWLAPANAILFTHTIATELCDALPDASDRIRENETVYTAALQTLDERFSQLVADATYDTILVGDRFPFVYLTEAYGIHHYAAFNGCEADTEASFETIVKLARKVDELSLPCILMIDGSDGKLAQTISEATERGNVPIRTLYSMQSVTREDRKAGVTYLTEMNKNYETLREALGV